MMTHQNRLNQPLVELLHICCILAFLIPPRRSHASQNHHLVQSFAESGRLSFQAMMAKLYQEEHLRRVPDPSNGSGKRFVDDRSGDEGGSVLLVFTAVMRISAYDTWSKAQLLSYVIV